MMHGQLHSTICAGVLALILTACRSVPTNVDTGTSAATDSTAPSVVAPMSAPLLGPTTRNVPLAERATAAPLPTPQTAEAGIVIAFIHAYNAGDLAAALALLDDRMSASDCDYQRVRPIGFMGKRAVADWLRQRMADHDQLTIQEIEVSGDAIGMAYSRRTSDSLQKLGFPDGIQPRGGTKVVLTSDRKHLATFANGPVGGDPEFCRPAPPLPTPQTAEAGIVITFIRAYNAGDLPWALGLLDDDVRVSDCEKFPVRSRSVGMVRIASRGSLVRHPSYAQNVNSLFFLIGAPTVPPQIWLRMKFGVRVIGFCTAFNAGLRPK